VTDAELIVLLGEALRESFPLHGPKWAKYQQADEAYRAYLKWAAARG